MGPPLRVAALQGAIVKERHWIAGLVIDFVKASAIVLILAGFVAWLARVW